MAVLLIADFDSVFSYYFDGVWKDSRMTVTSHSIFRQSHPLLQWYMTGVSKIVLFEGIIDVFIVCIFQY